jgi:hypothetical protein
VEVVESLVNITGNEEPRMPSAPVVRGPLLREPLVFYTPVPWWPLLLGQAGIMAIVLARYAVGASGWGALAEGLSFECAFVLVTAALVLVARRTWALRLTAKGLRTRLTRFDRISYEHVREIHVRSATELTVSLVSGESVALSVCRAAAAATAIESRLVPSNYREHLSCLRVRFEALEVAVRASCREFRTRPIPSAAPSEQYGVRERTLPR